MDEYLVNVKNSWIKVLKECISKDEWETINNNNNFYPNKENIFETFKYFELNEIKVIILGQDCYINEYKNIPQANGLAFSVNKIHKIPPSLKNIYKELSNTVKNFIIPNHGDLSRWVKEEYILLLNCSLTVQPKLSNSHIKYWTNITDKIIKYISDNCNNTVFILWGNYAKNKIKLIDNNKHHIITGGHPSPLSVRHFYGGDYFNKTNEYLIKNNINPVNWNI
jgi:uracil-DNA glycosylase